MQDYYIENLSYSRRGKRPLLDEMTSDFYMKCALASDITRNWNASVLLSGL